MPDSKISYDEFKKRLSNTKYSSSSIEKMYKDYSSGKQLPLEASYAVGSKGPVVTPSSLPQGQIAGKASPAKKTDTRSAGKKIGDAFNLPVLDWAGNKVVEVAKTAGKNVVQGIDRRMEHSKRENRQADQVALRRQASGKNMVDDLGLSSLLSSLDSYSQPIDSNFSYGDFSNQANEIAAKNFAPQYAALDQAQAGAQGQYDRADPIVAGLYEKLAGDIRNQAQQTQASYDGQEAQRAQQGAALQQNIGQTYQSTQGNQADLLAKLGIEDAAPATLQAGTDNSAWQQGQAGINTQLQVDSLNNAGNASADYQNNIANAEQTQGGVARQGLIAQLSQALSQIGQDRLGVASNQSQSATELANTLSQRDYTARQDQFSASRQAQQDAISLQMQKYGLVADADQRDYSRAQDDANMQLDIAKATSDAQIAQAEAAAKGQDTGLKFEDQGVMAKATTRMAQYGAQGMAALNIAQQVAGGNTAKSRGEFVAMVVNAGQGQGIKNQAILLEAANELADVMGLGKTPVAGQLVG